MNTQITLRPAAPDDAGSIAYIQVAVWHQSYAELVPPTLLERMTVDGRTKVWTKILESYVAEDQGRCFVAEVDGVIQGFASCGPQRDQDAKDQFSAEISAIYIQEAHQRCGIGRRLMSACAGSLMDKGHTSASLWVLAQNELARSFYTALAGAPVQERLWNTDDCALDEVAYGWQSLRDLLINS